MKTLALVVPCYNEEKTIPIFYETVEKIKPSIPAQVEYYFVDDGSRDGTLAIFRELHKRSDGVTFYLFVPELWERGGSVCRAPGGPGGFCSYHGCGSPGPSKSASPTAGWTGRGSYQFALFLFGYFIKSLINYLIRKLWMGPGTTG